MQYTVKKDSCY